VARVNCGQGNSSISSALSIPADHLTIEVSGLCQEHVRIERDNVTIVGTDRVTDGITGPALDDPLTQHALLRIDDARNVRLENLAIINGEGIGVETNGIASVEMVNCRVEGNASHGVQANGGGSLIIYAEEDVAADGGLLHIMDSQLGENGGIEVISLDGEIWCEGCTIDGDGYVSAEASGHGRIAFYDSDVLSGWHQGLIAVDGGTIRGEDSNAESTAITLWALRNAEITWEGGSVTGLVRAWAFSRVGLADVVQTGTGTNEIYSDSYLSADDSSSLLNTELREFSKGSAAGGATFGGLACESGSDFWCAPTAPGPAGSTCLLCPPASP
jgi:hypothetical protein